MTFTAACVQLRSSTNVAENIETVERLVREAAAPAPTTCRRPEMTNIVERNRASLGAAIRSEQDDPAVKRFARWRRELGIVLHIGSLALKAADGTHRQPRPDLRAGAASVLARYDKIHLFDVDLPNGESWREVRRLSSGRSGGCRRSALAEARRLDLLRSPLPAPLSRAGACRRGRADRAGRLHPADRRSALACAAAGARNRERRLRHFRRAGRPSRRRPRDLRPFDDRFALGRGAGRGRRRGAEVILAEIDPAQSADARQRIPALLERAAVSRCRMPESPAAELRAVS